MLSTAERQAKLMRSREGAKANRRRALQDELDQQAASAHGGDSPHTSHTDLETASDLTWTAEPQALSPHTLQALTSDVGSLRRVQSDAPSVASSTSLALARLHHLSIQYGDESLAHLTRPSAARPSAARPPAAAGTSTCTASSVQRTPAELV